MTDENKKLGDQADTVTAPVVDWETFRAATHNKDDDRLHQFEILSERDPASGRIITGPTGPDTALLVKFSIERVFSKYRDYVTKGEEPYVLQEFVTVSAPGHEKELTRHSPVEPIDMWRFPREYERFKAGLADGIDGTRLGDWKLMANETALIKELDQIGIQTVEQLASTSDGATMRNIRGFFQWKAKAKKFVDGNIKTEATINLEKKLEEQESAHKAEMADMNAKLAKLLDLLETKRDTEDSPKPKYQYKKKENTES